VGAVELGFQNITLLHQTPVSILEKFFSEHYNQMLAKPER
jgi:hypothetical protein